MPSIRLLALVIKIALKDFKANLSSARMILLVSFFGLFAVGLNLLINDSAKSFFKSKSREYLTADLRIRSNRPLNEAETRELETFFKPRSKAKEVSFLTMIRSQERSLLTQINAIDDHFPLIGSQELTPKKLSLKSGEAWIYPEIRDQLGVKIGDVIDIGHQRFKVASLVEKDVGFGGQVMSRAPKIYIRFTDAKKTGLFKFGSRLRYNTYALINGPIPEQIAIEELSARASMKELQISTPELSFLGLKKTVNNFLKIIAILALTTVLLCFLTSFQLLQVYIQDRISHLGILANLGLRRIHLSIYLFTQIAALCAASFIMAALALIGFAEWVNRAHLMPTGFQEVTLVLSWPSLLLLGLLALGINALLFLPVQLQILSIKIKSLIEQSAANLPTLSLNKTLVPSGMALSFFIGLSSLLTGSWLLALGLSGFVATAIVISLLLKPAFQGLQRLGLFQSCLSHLALLQLTRPRLIHILMTLAITYTAFLVSFIPNFYRSAEYELRSPKTSELPVFFILNIPKDRLADLTQYINSKGAEFRHPSPMLIARLIAVNGKPPQKERFNRFPVRLSYRSQFIESESLASGPSLDQPNSSSLPRVSMEVNFAERNNFKIGDVLQFKVSGLDLKAVIYNLRKVQWTSFQPNFFIQFEDGVLNDFPHDYIGVVYKIDQSQQARFQYHLSESFQELSIIDISRSIDRAFDITGKLLQPIGLLALISIFSCLLLFTLLAKSEASHRFKDLRLYSILGARPGQLHFLQQFEGFLRILWAAGWGILLAFVALLYICQTILPLTMQFDFKEPLILLGALFGLNGAIQFILVQSVKQKRPRVSSWP